MELVYTTDLKSVAPRACGFESRPAHQMWYNYLMENSKPTISQAISEGWQLTKSNYPILLGSFAILIGISIAFSIVDNITTVSKNNNPSTTVMLSLALASLVAAILRIGIQNLTSIGFTQIQLNILDKKPTGIGLLFNSENVFWRYLGTSIVYGLIILGGLILLIVPGIIWALKYQFALPLVIDKKMTLSESISKSGQITKGYKGWLLGFALVLGLINIAGFLALGVGLLFTIPLTAMSQIWVYRKLLGVSNSVTTPN